MKKTRVLCANGTKSGGGSERQMLGVLEHLDRGQFAPELYINTHTGELKPEDPADVPIHSFEHRHPGPVGKLPGAGFRARIRDLAKLLEEREIDVIYDRTYHMTLITAAAAKIRPTPRVSVIVTDNRRDFAINPERFRWIKQRLMRKAYLSADAVIAVSEGVRRAAAEFHHIPIESIQTSYNYFDVAKIDRLADVPLPGALGKQDNQFLVVAAGRLHPAKGYDLLIEAARIVIKEMGHARLAVWILGEGELRADLERQIRERDLEPQVRLLGFQDNPLRFLRAADLYCLCSRYEGMPNALVEALLCGTPVIAADCQSGPREILQEGKLGRLVPVENPRALADAIAEAIVEPARGKSLIPLAREQMMENFSLEAGISRTTEILMRAIETHARSHRT
jgi:glycosyltransferase involved in cell wall biosynthesis